MTRNTPRNTPRNAQPRRLRTSFVMRTDHYLAYVEWFERRHGPRFEPLSRGEFERQMVRQAGIGVGAA